MIFQEVFKVLTERKIDLSRIYFHYGKNHQKAKLIEEMAELQQVLAKDILDGKTDQDNLIEESADVLVVLFQLILNTMPCNKLADMMNFKIDRQLHRISSTEYGTDNI